MAYGSETHANNISYETALQHTPTGNIVSISVTIAKSDGTFPTESVRDQMFQVLLTKLSETPNTTIVSAIKRGNFTAAVTP